MKKMNIAISLFLCFFVLCGFYAESVQADIKGSLIRLHIIANSDSPADQAVKLKIRDRLTDFYRDSSFKDEGEALDAIGVAKPMVEEWLEEEKMGYGAEICVTADYFPTREYHNLKLPAGSYRAVKIVLGEGKGKNWWCVMFPPLCFTEGMTGNMDAEAEEYLKDKLNTEEYELITGSEPPVRVKFKIVELWQKFMHLQNEGAF